MVIFIKQIRRLRSSKSRGFVESTERRAEEIAYFAQYHVLCLHGYSYFAILQTLGLENCQLAAVWNLIWHTLMSQAEWNVVNCILNSVLSFENSICFAGTALPLKPLYLLIVYQTFDSVLICFQTNLRVSRQMTSFILLFRILFKRCWYWPYEETSQY